MECKKVSFINESFANEYINKLQSTSVRRIKPVRAYLCPKCLTWHLTSIEGYEQRKHTNRIKNYERQISNLQKRIVHLETQVEILTKKKARNGRWKPLRIE